jgi:hypothetical protein
MTQILMTALEAKKIADEKEKAKELLASIGTRVFNAAQEGIYSVQCILPKDRILKDKILNSLQKAEYYVYHVGGNDYMIDWGEASKG